MEYIQLYKINFQWNEASMLNTLPMPFIWQDANILKMKNDLPIPCVIYNVYWKWYSNYFLILFILSISNNLRLLVAHICIGTSKVSDDFVFCTSP